MSIQSANRVEGEGREAVSSRDSKTGRERRQDVRKPANWPGRVQWTRGEYTEVRDAVVRNYSAGGLYFELSGDELQPGILAECKVEMPAEIAFGRGVFLHAIGEVVHVRNLEGDAPGIGVGFRTDEMRFTGPGDDSET